MHANRLFSNTNNVPSSYSTISGNIWVEAFRKHITLMYMDNRDMISYPLAQPLSVSI